MADEPNDVRTDLLTADANGAMLTSNGAAGPAAAGPAAAEPVQPAPETTPAATAESASE
jgi:hypothetical protein